MNKIWMPCAIVGLIGLLTGCTTMGNGVTLQKEIPNIKVEELEVSGPLRIEVVCNAPKNHCTISAEENVWPSLEVKRDSEMKLKFLGGVTPTLPISVKIETTGDISEVELENNGVIKITGNQPNSFKASLKDSTTLSMAGRGIDKLKCEIEDSSNFSYAGRIGNADIRMENGVKFTADKVVIGTLYMRDGVTACIAEAEELTVNMRGGAKLEIGKLNGNIGGTARDACEILFGGNGKVNVKAPGTVKISKTSMVYNPK